MPVRHPRLALLALALLALLGYSIWLAGQSWALRSHRANADKALAAFDFDEAQQHLALCLQASPDDPDLLLLAARTARRAGHLSTAEQHLAHYQHVVGRGTPEEELERALLSAQKGRVPQVLPFLLDCLEEQHPQSELILESLARGCVQLYQLDRSLFWTAELLERWPHNAIGRSLRAQTLYTQGHRKQAIQLLQTLLEEFPAHLPARTALAHMLYKTQQFEEAATHYALLVERQPQDELACLGLATSWARMDKRDEARRLLDDLRRDHLDNSEVLLEWGRLALAEKRFTEAETALRRGVELAPFDHELHRELGACLGLLGQDDPSQKHLDRAKQIEDDLMLLEKTVFESGRSPNDIKPRRLAGEICLRNGQTAEALRWLQGALMLDPNDKATHTLLADHYATQNDHQRATYHRHKALNHP